MHFCAYEYVNAAYIFVSWYEYEKIDKVAYVNNEALTRAASTASPATVVIVTRPGNKQFEI